MRTLQVQSMRSQITKFQGSLFAQTLLDRGAPLLDVLRLGIELDRGKADRGRAQHGRRKVEVAGYDAGRWREIIALLCFRKYIRNVVSLIAPGIHVHRGKENAEGPVDHDSITWHVVREAHAGSKIKFV